MKRLPFFRHFAGAIAGAGAGLLFACSASLPAAELAGLKPGEKGPAFELKNQAGESVKLADLLDKGPVAVVFYRSADW